MSQVEFAALIAALPATAAFWTWCKHEPAPPLEGAAIDAYFATQF